MNLLISSYKDLEEQIKIHEKFVEIAQVNLSYYIGLLEKDAPRELVAITYDSISGSNGNAMTLDRIIKYINRYESMLEVENKIINVLWAKQQQIIECVNRCTGLEFKVVFKRDLQGMSLQEIADELGYDIGYIKNVSSKHKKCDFNVTDNVDNQ
ncbi:MAG: hypothetical protein ACOZCL_08535 [Bacillota bacterium]